MQRVKEVATYVKFFLVDQVKLLIIDRVSSTSENLGPLVRLTTSRSNCDLASRDNRGVFELFMDVRLVSVYLCPPPDPGFQGG